MEETALSQTEAETKNPNTEATWNMKRIVAISPKAQKRICDWVRNRERERDPGFRNRVLWLQRFIADECVFNFKSSLKWFIHLILFFSPSRLAEMWNHLQGPASCSLGRPYFTKFSLYRAHFFIVHIYDYDIVKNYALIWLWWCKVCMCVGHKFASDSWVKA